MILRDLEASNVGWLVSAHSKGFSEMGAVEAGEACVYPSGMIHETEIKSREILRTVGANAGRHALRRSGLALLGDYADVFDAGLTNLIEDGGNIAILSPSVGVDEDRGTGAFS